MENTTNIAEVMQERYLRLTRDDGWCGCDGEYTCCCMEKHEARVQLLEDLAEELGITLERYRR